MFKEIFHLSAVTLLSQAALLIFVLVFLGSLVWTYSRPLRHVKQWSNLPLEDGIRQDKDGEL